MKSTVTNLDLAHVRLIVDQEIDTYLGKEVSRARSIDPAYGRLLQTIREYIATGGKRLRPYLVMLLYAGYSGNDTDKVLPVATAWELVHTALLIHDDIIDRDDMRHGQPNVFGRYQKIYGQTTSEDVSHYAMSSALQAGVLLITSAQELVLTSNLSDSEKVTIIKLINQAIFQVGGGELLDTETALYPLHHIDARKIALQKTASYSFEMPMISGAVLAGASEDEVTTLTQIGTKLGMAYQLVDDVLGVFGETEKTGKSIDGDIRERKHTVLIQETHKRLQPKDQQELERYYDLTTELSDADIARVRELILKSGAKDVVLAEARTLSDQAEKLISELHITREVRDILLSLIAKLVKRNT